MMEYDPERALWRPGRRSFLFMASAAAVGLALSSRQRAVPLSNRPQWSKEPALWTVSRKGGVIDVVAYNEQFEPVELGASEQYEVSEVDGVYRAKRPELVPVWAR